MILLQTFNFEINDDFLEYITESSLAVEVYGNRSQGYESPERYTLKLPRYQDENKTPSERYTMFHLHFICLFVYGVVSHAQGLCHLNPCESEACYQIVYLKNSFVMDLFQ